MTQDEAVALISEAVRPATTTRGETWADFGAGTGTFSRALATILGEGSVVYAVDRDASTLREIEHAVAKAPTGVAEIRTCVGDFTRHVTLPRLDGAVIANALHYVPYDDQARVLAGVAALLKPHGALVVVEYDRRNANRWVPYPISFAAFADLARDAGLSRPVLLATRPSRYSGSIYSTIVRR